MARIEAMEPHRAALIAISRAESVVVSALRFPRPPAPSWKPPASTPPPPG
jgi:hypothetical protein